MRCDCLSLLAVITAPILLLHVGCQQKANELGIVQDATNVSQAGKPTPKITFVKVVHDFGDVTARKKYPAEFKFTNTGNSLLKITEVKQCCGVIAKLAKKEFAPGESGVLKVEFVSGPNSSLMKRIIYVKSNDKANPKVELTMKAKVVPKVTYEPNRLNLALNKENAGCPNITLTSADDQPFSIKDFQSTGGSISVDVNPSEEATKFVLHPKIDLEKLQKRSTGFISIDLTHPECKKVYLSFSTQLRFEFTPQSIILFNPELQKPIVKKVSVTSSYDEDFEVESTSSKNGIATVLDQKKIAKGYQFEVEIIPPPADDTGKFTDVLYVNLKGGETLSIKCYGRYLSK